MSATSLQKTIRGTHPLMVCKPFAHGAAPYRAIAIAPTPPPKVGPVTPCGPFPNVGSTNLVAPAAQASLQAQSLDLRPQIELIHDEHHQLVAILVPRPLKFEQLKIVEQHLVKAHWRPRIDLSDYWTQWRAYASPHWLTTIEAKQVPKPIGLKLFFA
jgi:hypothetical protein